MSASRARSAAPPSRGVIARYGHRLPVSEDMPVVTLGEGSTPLLPAPALSEMTGLKEPDWAMSAALAPVTIPADAAAAAAALGLE